jgi:CubicO group peptidase (beta-lactamase class C family)
MRRVESGLTGAIQVQGRAAERYSIQERLDHYHVPGVSVAVLDNGGIAWAKGYGVKDVTTGEPVLPETLFQAASISKPLAAMAALKLVEEGLLALDAPVNQYLKSWKLPENRFTEGHPVTLRHLLTHTGGLTVHGFPGYAVGDPVATTTEVLDGTGPANTPAVRVDTIPGSLWRYSGGGYTIVQQLLEDVTGKPFPELMQELVLEPAGMPISSYVQPLPPGRAGYAATAHLSDGTPAEGKWHIYPEMAAAGLWTNPTELAQLALDVQGSYRGEAGHILSPEMTRAQLTPGMGGYGLGFGVQGEGSSAQFSHGGSNHGFKAQFMAFMEGGRGVFIMTNGDRGSALAQEIVLAVAREYGWPTPSYQEVVLANIPADLLHEIAGMYTIEASGLEVRVLVEGDHLKVEVRAPEEAGEPQFLEIYPTAENFFIDLSDGSRFRVERDTGGAVTAIQIIGGPRAERAGGRIPTG